MASRYTEAEIFEAVFCAVGDDGHRAKETLAILKQNRKSQGLICNRTYSLWNEDFARFLRDEITNMKPQAFHDWLSAKAYELSRKGQSIDSDWFDVNVLSLEERPNDE